MKFFTQSYLYDDSWSIVSLAFFLRYPNPYASHVVSCDVISRTHTASGSLLTTRLILKRGALPRWAPKGIITRVETWVVEESEVDPLGKTVRCLTRNLDNVKVMQVSEEVLFRQTEDGKTLQTTEARILSGFGWGLTKRIENHGLTRFKQNVQRSREGVTLILDLIRQSRLQPVGLGVGHASLEEIGPTQVQGLAHQRRAQSAVNTPKYEEEVQFKPAVARVPQPATGRWTKLKSWLPF